MILINPVSFNRITKKHRYTVNPQFLRSYVGPKEPLAQRVNCTLRAAYVRTKEVPGNSYIEFICVKEEHSNRFCTFSGIKIEQQVFRLGVASSGNVLVQLFSGRCDACGEDSDRCWLEFTGHKVCSRCVAMNNSTAPYPYGTVGAKCCSPSNVGRSCGAAAKWYSDSDAAVYRKAVQIYEKYKVA